MIRILILIIWGLCNGNEIPETYKANAIVTECNKANDTVTFTMENGNMFSIYGVEDWLEGDTAELTMATQGTTDQTDDIILSVRYTGWIY